MSEFGNMTIEGSLANEVLDTIKQFEWNPSLTATDAVRSLVMVLDHITLQYSAYDEIEQE